MKIEDFRSLNQDIETIINKSEKVKKAKTEKDNLSKAEKNELTKEENEYKSLREKIQKKLIKLATRIPVFMYLTDYREYTLKDVITQLEPGLFKKVTGLSVKDFDMLCSLGVFNTSLMNDAVFKFKRYEDSSLSYAGVNMHSSNENVGGWDTELSKEDYDRYFYNQQCTMQAPKVEDYIEDIVKATTPPKTESKPTEPTVKPAPTPTANPTPVLKPTPTPTVMPTPKPIVNPYNKNNNYTRAVSSLSAGKNPANKKLPVPEISLNMSVNHKKFGVGHITKIDDSKGYVYVKFSSGEKLFGFPGAFENGHLAAVDE